MIGQILLNRYRIDTMLGQGGTSDVFKSFDLTLQRTVAVKMLTRSVDIADRAYERFLREAQHTSRLSHPNIVSIFDYGVFADTNPFLVTEYLNGPTLQDILDEETKIEIGRALLIFKHIAEGLSHAHAAGIIHRDVKPSNVLLATNIDGGDFVKIIDFGFVHVVAPGNEMQKLTLEDGILGSAFYVSPEQCSGKVADERSDIYALGCLMYECISGMVPICGSNLLETFQMHIHDEPEKLSEVFGEELPDGLEELIMSCLEKNPANRPQTMKQVAAAILQCIIERGKTPEKSSSGATINGVSARLGEEDKSRNQDGAVNPREEENSRRQDDSFEPKKEEISSQDQANASHKIHTVSELNPAKSRMRLALVGGAIVLLGLSALAMTNLSNRREHTDTDPTNSADMACATNGSRVATSTDSIATVSATKSDGVVAASSPNGAGSADSSSASESGNKIANSGNGKAAEVDHLVTLAKECHAQGKCDEAVSSKVYGPKSKETKARMKDLAVMYLTLGMQKEADQLMSKVGRM